MTNSQTNSGAADLIKQSKRRIMKFGIACAWADLELTAEEIKVIYDVADEIRLDAVDRADLPHWLSKPPAAEEVDPARMSPLEASMCLVVAKRIIEADGKWSDEEVVLYNIIRELFGPNLNEPGRNQPARRSASHAA